MDKYLTIIQYESAADQTFLVMNNEQIFSYYENPETNINVMLSIMTKEQYETLLSKGYYIQVVEKNPEITNYALYENAELNQGALLAPLGKVYILTNNHTLIRKADQTVVYDIEPSTFIEIPLKDMKAEIAQNNNVDLSEKVVENTKELKIGPPPISHPSPVLDYILNPGIIFVILAFVAIIGFIAWKKFRKTPPQTINEPPIPPIN
jgi:hypothetical protein